MKTKKKDWTGGLWAVAAMRGAGKAVSCQGGGMKEEEEFGKGTRLQVRRSPLPLPLPAAPGGACLTVLGGEALPFFLGI